MIRVSWYFWSVSLQTYQLRALEFFGAAAGALEPVVLVGGVIDDELGDDAQAAPLGFLDEALEILHGPEIGIDVAIVGDVVTVVAAGRGIERQQPQRGDAEVLQIAELLGQSGKIADAVIVAVGKGLDVQLIDDGVLVPKRIALGVRRWHFPCIHSEAAAVVQRVGGIESKGGTGLHALLGAFAGLGFFVHGDAIAMEMTPPFHLRKGDDPDI